MSWTQTLLMLTRSDSWLRYIDMMSVCWQTLRWQYGGTNTFPNGTASKVTKLVFFFWKYAKYSENIMMTLQIFVNENPWSTNAAAAESHLHLYFMMSGVHDDTLINMLKA